MHKIHQVTVSSFAVQEFRVEKMHYTSNSPLERRRNLSLIMRMLRLAEDTPLSCFQRFWWSCEGCLGFTGSEHSHGKWGRWGLDLVQLRAAHHSRNKQKNGFLVGCVHASVVYHLLNSMIDSDDLNVEWNAALAGQSTINKCHYFGSSQQFGLDAPCRKRKQTNSTWNGGCECSVWQLVQDWHRWILGIDGLNFFVDSNNDPISKKMFCSRSFFNSTSIAVSSRSGVDLTRATGVSIIS